MNQVIQTDPSPGNQNIYAKALASFRAIEAYNEHLRLIRNRQAILASKSAESNPSAELFKLATAWTGSAAQATSTPSSRSDQLPNQLTELTFSKDSQRPFKKHSQMQVVMPPMSQLIMQRLKAALLVAKDDSATSNNNECEQYGTQQQEARTSKRSAEGHDGSTREVENSEVSCECRIEIKQVIPVIPKVTAIRMNKQDPTLKEFVHESQQSEPGWRKISLSEILDSSLLNEIPVNALDLMFVSGDQFTDS